jgi:transcriptional regulator GlxA family with amidase domain
VLDSVTLSRHGSGGMPECHLFPPIRSPRAVEVLAFPGVQLLDVAGPLQVFASANDLACMANAPPPYALRVVAAEGASVVTSAGLGLVAMPLPNPEETEVDTLVVAGGFGIYEATENIALIAWIRARARRARRIASVCSGAFLLGAAGLLDGRRAVTHWTRCAALSRRYPAVRVEADPIFIQDGPIWTSAGITAGIDLALALLEQDLGHAPALAVARHLVVFLKRPGGQAQFSAVLALQHEYEGATGRFEALHAWAADHLAGDLSLPALAARAGMSERSFVRHYRSDMGTTPARAIERLRVEAARGLLTDAPHLPAKRVAVHCGFGSEETMRRAFLRMLAITPQEYRERFAGVASRFGPGVEGQD